jgi:hypothetical protein
MIHESAERYFRGLNKGVKYFAQIEAIGETGVSNRSNVIEF